MHLISELARRIREIEALDALVPPLPPGLGNLLMRALELPPGRHIGELRSRLEALCEAGEILARQEPDYYVEVVRSRGLAEGLQVVPPRGVPVVPAAEPALPGTLA
jgi:poly(A) polymerase